jgi:2-polyprenyl-3-methyl-5-hydroxy-6-metoxy-1,4-benzoquinol methylase
VKPERIIAPTMSDEAFPARLARIGQAFQESKIVLLAVDLGVFERLATGPATATELARDLTTTERGMEILTDALAATGYLIKRGDRLANTNDVERYLVPGGPDSVAHIMGHRNEMFSSWARLDEIIRQGQTRREEDKPTLSDPKANRNFILGMAEVGLGRVGSVLDRLPLADGQRLVDLGGGPGHFACAAARRFPTLTATVVDLPLTVSVASEYVARQELADRVSTQVCDFYRSEALDLGGVTDGVLISQVLHAEGVSENRALLDKLAAHVRPGGWVAIVENLIDATRTSPVGAAMFAVNMLAGTARGRTYTAAEIAGWLDDAGFAPAPAEQVAERTWVILGRKR